MTAGFKLMAFFWAFLSTCLSYSSSAINNVITAVVQLLLAVGRLVVTRFFDKKINKIL